MGEFGRTPKINKDAGRDHWGRAGSLLFAGAGVQGGQVIGATDKNGAFVTDRPVRPGGRLLDDLRSARHRPGERTAHAGRPARSRSSPRAATIKELFA